MVKEPTEEQSKILQQKGNIVITAKPGSGKTYTIVEKIARVIPDLPEYKGVIGIRNFRLNLKNVCTDGICQIFSNFCGNTAGRKIGDKSFAHGNALPLDDFV